VAIDLHVTHVSEAKGTLVIDVVDEYTYYAEGSPHVKDARVLVKHPTTGQVISQGLTGTDGHYRAELAEGWYTVSINADTLTLSAYEVYNHSIYDSLRVVKEGPKTQVIDFGRQIPEYLEYTPDAGNKKDRSYAERIEEYKKQHPERLKGLRP
jgi:hypothetical protein